MTGKTNPPHTPVLLFLETVLSVLTEVLNLNFINKILRLAWARCKHFPDLLRYIDPTVEEQNFVVAIIHIGINDILYDSSLQQIKFIFQNINK